MDNTELLELWEIAKVDSTRLPDFAKSHGLTEGQARGRLSKARGVQRGVIGSKVSQVKPTQGDGVSVSVENNRSNVVLKGKRVVSLEDLIEVADIDLKRWLIPAWEANKWEVGVKVGSGDDVRVVAEPLFQVKAKMLKREPEQIYLPIAPMTLSSQVYKAPKPGGAKSVKGRALIVSDVQLGFRRDNLSGSLNPFHDRRALDVVLQIAQDNDFTEIVFIGDLLDLSEWSDKFLREPSFYFTTQPAVIEGHYWLSQFAMALPKARKRKLEGNHEVRLPTMLATHLLSAFDLRPADNIDVPVMTVNNLLGLEGLGIEYVNGYPNNETFVGDVRVIHGNLARKGTTDTVKGVIANAEESTVMGHIHKIELASRTIRSNGKTRTVTAFSAGCLCRVDYVVPGHGHGQQWQQGSAVIEWEGDQTNIVPIYINEGKAIYNSKLYKARETVSLLNKQTKDVRKGWQF